MVGDKVAGMYGALEKDPTNRALTAPIYVSNDGYVLDGHHRWAAIVTYNAKNPNNPIPMKVRIIDLPIKPLVRLANDFADSIGIEKKAAVAGQMAKGGQVSLGDWEFDEHGWAYSYGKLKAKNRSFGFMVSVDPKEKASVSWDSPYMQNATWDKKVIDEVRKDMPITNEMAKGGVLSDVDMYVKIHGYYPEEVMALRGDGMGLGIVKNEAHKFELSSEDSRKAEEMGYEFDYYDAKGWVEKEDDDDFAKGGEIQVGDLVKVKKYGWVMKVDKVEDDLYYLENDKIGKSISGKLGNPGSYSKSQLEKIDKDNYAKGG
jgi:hypothetical protein